MTELEKIEYAKSFIDKLANGINPLDDTQIADGDIVNNVRLSRCFFFVSDVLRQVIDNGGINPPAKQARAGKQAFTLSEEAKANLQVSEIPLTISELVTYLNGTIDKDNTKSIATTAITGWLMDQGFLEAVELPGGKTTKLPTSAGNEIGLLTEERMGMYGTYTVVKYSAAAQTFIFDHMEAIMAHHEQFKAAQKEAKAAAKAQKEAARADTPSVPPPPTHFQSSFLDRPWTATHDERLRSMFMAGATVSDMAGAIKRTEAGIRTRLQELGLQ